MATNRLSRRQLIQSASLLLAGSAVPALVLGQVNNSQTGDTPKPVCIPPGGGRKAKISKTDITFKLDKTQTR